MRAHRTAAARPRNQRRRSDDHHEVDFGRDLAALREAGGAFDRLRRPDEMPPGDAVRVADLLVGRPWSAVPARAVPVWPRPQALFDDLAWALFAPTVGSLVCSDVVLSASPARRFVRFDPSGRVQDVWAPLDGAAVKLDDRHPTAELPDTYLWVWLLGELDAATTVLVDAFDTLAPPAGRRRIGAILRRTAATVAPGDVGALSSALLLASALTRRTPERLPVSPAPP